MFANLALAGNYRFDGSRYTDHTKRFYLVVSHRKNPNTGKPGTFLVAKTVDGRPFPTYPYRGQSYQYVSSLFPIKGTSSYIIEYIGDEYKVDLTSDSLTISTWSNVNRTDGTHHEVTGSNFGIELLPPPEAPPTPEDEKPGITVYGYIKANGELELLEPPADLFTPPTPENDLLF